MPLNHHHCVAFSENFASFSDENVENLRYLTTAFETMICDEVSSEHSSGKIWNFALNTWAKLRNMTRCGYELFQTR